ncbi:hypothetical protein I552_0245 [Mycobacterium xenopi 3993]|nr:hypothetical protein I552_0245 [Mycobacterium xenopi 3993]
MTGVHPDIGPELRKLAQTILDGIDPPCAQQPRAPRATESAPVSVSKCGARCVRWQRW